MQHPTIEITSDDILDKNLNDSLNSSIKSLNNKNKTSFCADDIFKDNYEDSSFEKSPQSSLASSFLTIEKYEKNLIDNASNKSKSLNTIKIPKLNDVKKTKKTPIKRVLTANDLVKRVSWINSPPNNLLRSIQSNNLSSNSDSPNNSHTTPLDAAKGLAKNLLNARRTSQKNKKTSIKLKNSKISEKPKGSNISRFLNNGLNSSSSPPYTKNAFNLEISDDRALKTSNNEPFGLRISNSKKDNHLILQNSPTKSNALANRSIITKKILNYRELLSDLLPENIEKNSSTHQNLTIKNESSNFYDTDSVFITQPEFNRSSLSDNLNSCSSQKSTSASNPEISSYSSSINKNLYNTADNIPDFVSPSHPSPKEDLDKSSTSINIDESIKSHDPISLIGGRDLNNKTDSTSNEINQINLISDLDDDFFDCLDFESLEALAVQNSQLQPNIIENHTLPDKNIPSPKKVGNTASITRKNSTDTDNNNNIEILDNEIDSFDDIEDLAQLELKLQEIEKNSSISTIPPKNKKPSDLVNEDHEAALLDILESQYIGRTSNDWEYSTCEKFLTVAVRSADEDFSFNSSSEKIIVAISEETQKEVIIQLQDLWSQTQIFEGDLFNVLPALTLGYDSCPEKNKQQNHFVFNKHTNYLFILHPDELIPATMLAGAFPCQRRAVLKSKFKSQVIEDLLKTNQDPEKKIYDLLLIGNITHSLFQYAAVNDVWSEDLLDEALDKILVDNIQEIWNIKSDLETIKSKMAPKISKIIEFASNYIYGYKKNSSTSSQFFKHPSILKKPFADKIPEKKNSLNIYKVVDFEENVRSPRLGLKGNIDMTVLGSFSKPFEQKKFEIIPFEIKSGKPGNSSQSSHTAQLLIYTLLLSERYKMNVKHGVLSYITYGDLFVVKQDINYIKELICTRNNLALYLNTKEHTTIRLPPMVGKVYTCKNCPVASVCFLTHKAIEGGTHLTSKVPEEFWYSQVGELTQKGLDFYKRWTNLIENEEFESKSSLSEMWTLTPEERASKGDCILDMEVLDCANFFFDTNYGTNLKSKVRFGKRDKKGKLLNLVHHFQVGDHMVVSR
ncbi:DNA replication ATP-dependent helicase/nuclease DNA2, partial [Smittium culicis]